MRTTRSHESEGTRRARRRGAGLAVAALAALALAGAQPAQAAPPIAASELSQRIEAGTAPLILDVRSTEEYKAGHIPGALHIAYDELAQRLDELPVGRDDEIVVHCHSGRRAGVAEKVLAEAGYTQVRDLEGHWKGWIEAGLPTE